MLKENLLGKIEFFPKDAGQSLESGLVYASNEARFTSANYSEALTGYTIGWRDSENLEAMLERLFPSVAVGRRYEFKAAENAEAFLTEEDDARAINAPFKRVESTGTTVLGKTINRGLTTRVDHDEAFGNDWRERKVAWLLQRIIRNEYRRCWALLDAAATNAARTWTVAAAANPDKDIRDALRLATDASGVRPNIVVFGELAFDARLDVYEGLDTPYAGRAASMSPAELARKYMVDFVEIVKARYQSSAAAKTAIVPSVVYEYLATQGADKDDASNFKRFVSPSQRGPRFGVYIEEHPKFTDVSVEHYSAPTVTSTLGIRKQTITSA